MRYRGRVSLPAVGRQIAALPEPRINFAPFSLGSQIDPPRTYFKPFFSSVGFFLAAEATGFFLATGFFAAVIDRIVTPTDLPISI